MVRDLFFRGRLVREFLDEIYESDEYAAVGFKFMYSQARGFPYRRAPTVVNYAKEQGLKVIHVVRDNALKTMISRSLAKRTGVYHVKGETSEKTRITIPTSTLISDLYSLRSEDEEWSREFDANPYFKVHYEEFVQSPERIASEMLDFLGMGDDKKLTSPHKKVITSGLEDVIENYDDVKRTLDGTEFAGFLT